MFKRKQSYLFLVGSIVISLLFVGCGGDDEAATVVEEAPPVTAVEEAAPVKEAEPVVVEVATFDPVVAVDDYLSAIPEGYMSVGNVEKFKALMETGEAVIIDVREVAEYEEGHIPGAINIPLRTLAQNLDQIPTDKPVVTYCKSGHRAGLAVSALRLIGYDNARAFPASYKGWVAAEEAITTEVPEAVTYADPGFDPDLVAATDDFLSTIPEGFLAMGDIEKLNEAIDNGALMVDVREASEFEKGHIPEAINVPIRTLASSLDQIPSDRPVFVYCQSGYRAALSTTALQVMGYSNVRAFPPSFAGWESAGAPIAMAE